MLPRVRLLLASAALAAIAAIGFGQVAAPPELSGNPATRPAERDGREPMGFGRGGRVGGFDMLNGMQARLSATDEEWKVISPMLQRVSAARRVAESGLDPEAEAQPNVGGDNLQFVPGGGRGFDRRGDGRGDAGFDRGFRGAPGADTFAPATRPVDPNAPTNQPTTRALDEGGRGGRRAFGGPGEGFNGPGGGRFSGPGGNPDGPGGGRGGFGRPAGDRNGNGNGTERGGPGSGGPGGGGPGGNPFGGFGGGGPGGGGGRGGPGGPGGGPGGFGRGNAVTSAISDLRTTLADKSATPEQVKEKVAAVRAARAKAIAELSAAQQELHELLTTDQEAVLVSEGLLD